VKRSFILESACFYIFFLNFEQEDTLFQADSGCFLVFFCPFHSAGEFTGSTPGFGLRLLPRIFSLSEEQLKNLMGGQNTVELSKEFQRKEIIW